jgi:hypothetical protein
MFITVGQVDYGSRYDGSCQLLNSLIKSRFCWKVVGNYGYRMLCLTNVEGRKVDGRFEHKRGWVHIYLCKGKEGKGARNQVEIGLSYRPARPSRSG